ncbi:MAG: winged helix-turn-helix transcriptional regulator [Thaumarchaeota archaeon]|nr:winged helix-turn-helix transcriptional regulator [Nitrososphaerota archaeon]
MLVEIPDPEVILSIVIAFFVGLFALYLYTKIHVLKANSSTLNLERLDYYERQLIDMKIRLDALDLLDAEPWSESNNYDLKPVLENSHKKQELIKDVKDSKKQRLPNLNSNDMIDVILGLIMDKPMTSHDIQITIGRTREHVSRLMKKLYQDGLVERNTKTKPFAYSITESGKAKVSLLKNNPITA